MSIQDVFSTISSLLFDQPIFIIMLFMGVIPIFFSFFTHILTLVEEENHDATYEREEKIRNERLCQSENNRRIEDEKRQASYPWNNPNKKLFSECPHCGSAVAWPYVGNCIHCGGPLGELNR